MSIYHWIMQFLELLFVSRTIKYIGPHTEGLSQVLMKMWLKFYFNILMSQDLVQGNERLLFLKSQHIGLFKFGQIPK